MNLTNLSDQKLMASTKALIKQETKVIVAILHHIKEIDRRRLYADYKQPGLLELVINELNYPRDQAIRRIQAMRMMREIPQVERMINSGELSLTHIGVAQTLFSHQKKEGKAFTQAEKIEILNKMSGTSTREAQKLAFSYSTTPIKFKDKIRMISEDDYDVQFRAKAATVQNIETLKGMLAHSHPGISLDDLIFKLTELGLEHFKPVKPVAAPRPDSKAEIKRQVWLRDEYQCTNCGSRYAVQEDHRRPKAKGGEYSLGNMRLLCRSCNQRAAIKHFGVENMEHYF